MDISSSIHMVQYIKATCFRGLMLANQADIKQTCMQIFMQYFQMYSRFQFDSVWRVDGG